MKLHELKPAVGSRKSPKRLGRGSGSGLGTTAGKGQKGQNAMYERHAPKTFPGSHDQRPENGAGKQTETSLINPQTKNGRHGRKVLLGKSKITDGDCCTDQKNPVQQI